MKAEGRSGEPGARDLPPSALPMTRIVLTGGPGAGKTSVAAALARIHPHILAHVPEAATQVYDRLGTRWDRLDAEGRREVQRRIYRLQLEQEDRLAQQHPGRVL